MIEKMLKLSLFVRAEDQERLVHTLRQSAVLHLSPLDLTTARPAADIQSQLRKVNAALEVLARAAPAAPAAVGSVTKLAEAVIAAEDTMRACRNRISVLRSQLEEQKVWGQLELAKIRELNAAGVELRFFSMPAGKAEEFSLRNAAYVQNIGRGKSLLILAACQEAYANGEIKLPEGAEELKLPERDNPELQRELQSLEAQVNSEQEKLSHLAAAKDRIKAHKFSLDREAAFSAAENSGLLGETIYALEGWVPAARREQLTKVFDKESEFPVLLQFRECTQDDQPPTLISYPWWSKPIKGLFDILGTMPGYRETDLSGFFMLALPLFAGMLIGDAGYGLLFCLGVVFFYRPLKKAAGYEKTLLFLMVGLATLLFGMLTANWWGVGPEALAKLGGFTVPSSGAPDVTAMLASQGRWARLGRIMVEIAPFWERDPAAARIVIMKLSFILGAVHLVLAHLSRFIALFPSTRILAELGWIVFILVLLAVIWVLFFHVAFVSNEVVLSALLIGVVLTICFSIDSGAWYRRWSLGLASSLLTYLGSFSDLMSYIRLMAVGLASFYIAGATNELAEQAAQGSFLLVGVGILLIGHGLNIALGAIAVFAHGVRLNMLEFSNNAGVQWAGYNYAPFADLKIKEG